MRELLQRLSEHIDLKSFFYEGEIAICVIFILAVWWLKPKSPESNFKVREADLRKTKKKLNPTGGVDPLAEARISRIEPLKVTGISIHGLPHEILGVSAQATRAEITVAYRKLMKQYHPDKLGSQLGLNVQPGVQADVQKIAEAINRAKETMLKNAPS